MVQILEPLAFTEGNKAFLSFELTEFYDLYPKSDCTYLQLRTPTIDLDSGALEELGRGSGGVRLRREVQKPS